jgi:hypothetical protein
MKFNHKISTNEFVVASQDRLDEASVALSRVLDEDPSSAAFEAQMLEIREVAQLEKVAQGTKISDLWTGEGRNLYRLCLACGVQLMGQIGGINILAYYIVIIFQTQLGLGNTLSRVLAACAGIGWLFSNLFSMTVIEKWGRRPILMLGSAGQCLCFLISGIVLAVAASKQWAGIVVVICVYMYFIVFAFAWQAIPYLYPAEILSLKYRARFYGVANGCNWAINYAVVLVSPIGIANLGWKFYMIFAVFNFVNGIIVWFFYFETARRSLEEVDLFFLGSKEADSTISPTPFLRLRGTPKHNGEARRAGEEPKIMDDDEKMPVTTHTEE